MTVLVTGAGGSVGQALCAELPEAIATDIAELNVTNARAVRHLLLREKPDVIYHLAGAKHAPEGELDPWHVLEVNAIGTQNILDGAENAKVILASTCKACDPETAYGASKLIAERMVLNAGGVVVRFHNIPESSGNVFRIWEALPKDAPIPVTDCWRYLTPLEKAIELLVEAPSLQSGRYCVDPGDPVWIPRLAAELYPDRQRVVIPRRRGDRHREPLYASCEQGIEHGRWLRIEGSHDPVLRRAI